MTKEKYLFLILVTSFVLKFFLYFFYNSIPFPDALSYGFAGKQLFTNGFIDVENIMPLFPIINFLAESSIGIIPVNIFISTLSVFYIYKLTNLIFEDHFSSIIAATWMAFYPFNFFYSYHALTETLYILLIILAFYHLYKSSFIIASIFFVLGILTRPNHEILAPVLIFVFAYFTKKNFKFSLRQLFYYFVVYILLMLPWWAHQYKKYGYFVRTNFGLGLVLYSGNNPMNTTGGGVRIDIKDIEKYPHRFNRVVEDFSFKDFEGKPGFKQISNTFPVYEGGTKAYLIRNNTLIKAALDYIKNNPKRFFELSILKLKRFWSPVPFSQEFQSIFVIIISLLSLLPIYIFGLFGIFKSIKQKIYKILPIVIYCLFINLIHVITISSFRYRFIIEPYLIILASYGIVQILKKTKLKKWLIT